MPSAQTGSATAGTRRPGQILLAIDTSAGAVSACVFHMRDLKTLREETLLMERGHAEALLPLLDRLVSNLDDGFASLGRIAVTIGPGSFTGIRVGVAAARALGLACRCPVVGISTLAALAAPVVAGGPAARIIAAIDAKHGHVYAQGFAADGMTLLEARHTSVTEIVKALGPGPLRLVGSGAPMVAIEAWSQGIGADVIENGHLPKIALVARLGMLAKPETAPAKPLYLKPPDAKPLPRQERGAPSVAG